MNRRSFVMAGLAFVLAGCGITLNVENVSALAGTAGTTAAVVANCVSTDAKTKYVIAKSVETASRLTPIAGTSAKEAWQPVIDSVVADAVAKKALTDEQAKAVLGVFSLVTDAFVYFEAKYPEVKTDRELMSAAIGSFCDAFLKVYDAGDYKPETDGCDDCKVDLPLYRQLKSRLREVK